jgi:hypothetical protein
VKNQNDLIISIVAIVFGLIGVGIFYGTKPQAKTEAAPTTVNTSAPQIQGADVKMANALPGGGGAGGGGGTARFGGGGGPRAGGMAGGPASPPPGGGGPMVAGMAGGAASAGK